MSHREELGEGEVVPSGEVILSVAIAQGKHYLNEKTEQIAAWQDDSVGKIDCTQVLFDPPDNPEWKEKPDSTLKNKIIIIEIVMVIIIAGCGGTGCNHTWETEAGGLF